MSLDGPINLAAVRRARNALEALVAAYPSLKAADPWEAVAVAEARETQEMPPRLDPETDTELVAVRLTASMIRAIDAEVARRRAADPDVAIGRSNVIRSLIRTTLMVDATTVPAPKSAPSALRVHVEGLRLALSAAEIAARAGVSESTVARVLRGASVSAASEGALLALSLP